MSDLQKKPLRLVSLVHGFADGAEHVTATVALHPSDLSDFLSACEIDEAHDTLVDNLLAHGDHLRELARAEAEAEANPPTK